MACVHGRACSSFAVTRKVCCQTKFNKSTILFNYISATWRNAKAWIFAVKRKKKIRHTLAETPLFDEKNKGKTVNDNRFALVSVAKIIHLRALCKCCVIKTKSLFPPSAIHTSHPSQRDKKGAFTISNKHSACKRHIL